MMNPFQLLAIAQSNPEGFTVCKKTGQPIKSGYAVAIAETQNNHKTATLNHVLRVAEKRADVTAIGGWMDKQTGLYYFDAVCIIGDRDKAIEAGLQNGQIAIFHLDTMTEIRLQSEAQTA